MREPRVRCVQKGERRQRPKAKKKLTAADYEQRKIRGWTVHIEKSLKDHKRLPVAVKLLNTKLGEIEKRINPEILPKLKSVPIWLNKNIRTGACYHPNPKWLSANNRMAEKHRCIELQNINNFIDWSNTQPMMVLHELAHAYHHQAFGFQNPVITAAYKNIVASGKYEKVKHANGKTKRHYALNNEKEYFSECTEAYFGRNDFFPFTRADLKEYDPQGYAMVESVWKVQ